MLPGTGKFIFAGKLQKHSSYLKIHLHGLLLRLNVRQSVYC